MTHVSRLAQSLPEEMRGRVRVVSLESFSDGRGRLTLFEAAGLVLRRVFLIDGAPDGVVRGGHAHQSGMQMLVCISGQVDLELFCAGRSVTITLDRPTVGLLVGPRVWARQIYREKASLLVMSDEPYAPDKYINDQSEL